MELPNIDIDYSLDPKELGDIYYKTDFDLGFRRFIARDVIKYFSFHNQESSQDGSKILRSLERFIFGLAQDASDQDVKSTIEHIQTLNQPNKLCRRALKPGDVTFSCNDCGLDQTCVVCIDCFHKSAHKDHNYRMANSDGGGCCDCGDVEAWTQNYACTDHLVPNQPNLTLSNFEDHPSRAKQISEDKKDCLKKLSQLSKDMTSRYFFVCQAALHYAREIVHMNHQTELGPGLEIEVYEDDVLAPLVSVDKTSRNYFTVLFNDEIHTYDHVINTLVKIIKCSKMTASIMASTISREGRAIIFNDNFEACRHIQDFVWGIRDGGLAPLEVEVMHRKVLAHQAFALKLLEWIRTMSSLCDAYRIITAYSLFGPFDETEDSSSILIDNILCSNTFYWKSVRIEWNDLFVTVLLTEYSIKEKFARIITRLYDYLMGSFIKDSHDHSVSTLTMTTQLYTVPSLVCMLIEEEDALSILSKTLLGICKANKRENQGNNYENRSTFDMSKLRRAFYIISDLKYLINIKPTKWTDKLRQNVINGVKIFIDLLNLMQGMDPVKRQMGQHIEYEPDWESGMNLQQRLVLYITRLVTYCSFDEEVLVSVIRETQVKLAEIGNFKMVNRNLFGYSVNCVQYDVATSPVSVHLPLTRFAAALILELMKLRSIDRVPYDQSLVILTEPKDKRRSMIELLEPSLRTEVMIAQFRSGMWRRNGYSLVNSIVFFHGPLMRKEMFDRDILLLQECAAMYDPNEFMIHLLNKYQLFTWISCETTREPMVGTKSVSIHNDEDIMTQTMSLGEEFLQILLSIISERYCPGIGKVSEEDVIKNEIIQLLCISPLTRSDLTHKLNVYDNELDCIKAVAILKRTSEATAGVYELKDEYYNRFNPFFYHYSRRNQSNALDAQLKRKKNLKESLICCPPPKPVELTKQFSNINEILKCDILLILIKKILKRALGVAEGSQECSTKAQIRFLASDLQLDQCLHLIGLGLYEQERDPIGFNYIQAAHNSDIFQLLRSCHDDARRSKDLIFWLMRKTDQLIDLLYENHPNNLDERFVEVLNAVKECFKPILATSILMKQGNKKRNSEHASQLQNRIMAMMKANQDKFMANPKTKQLVEETAKNEAVSLPKEVTSQAFVSTPSSHLCILCRDEQQIGFDQPTMVLLAYIQRSAIMSKNREGRRIPNYVLTPSNQLKYLCLYQPSGESAKSNNYSFTSDNSRSFDATFMPSDLFFGPHISTCGHAMHHQCWNGFFQTIMRRETSRPNRITRHVSFELEKFEVLCPLCECISNATIPLMPNWTNFADRIFNPNQKAFTIFSAGDAILSKSSENLSTFLLTLKGTVDSLNHVRFNKSTVAKNASQDDKYIRLIQPRSLNDVLEDLEEKEALSLRDFVSSLETRTGGEADSKLMTPNQSLLNTMKSLADRIHTVGLDLDRSIADVHDARIFMMTSWCISYTIQTLERVSRFKGSPIFEELESSKNLCVTSLLRFACASPIVHHSDPIRDLLVRKLRYLLVNDEHMSSSPCILDIDAFELFVSIFILLQKLYALENDELIRPTLTRAFDHEYFRNLLHLMVILNMVQVFISILNETYNSQDSTDNQDQKREQSGENLVLMNFFKEIIVASGHPNSKVSVMDQEFIKYNLLPFLRSCALFFFHLSGIRPPQELREERVFFEGKNFSSTKTDESVSMDAEREQSEAELTSLEFNAICKYLDLPHDLNKLLQSQEACHLACSWLRHSRVLPLIKSAIAKESETDPMHQITSLKRAASSTSLQQPYQFSSSSSTINTSSSFPSQPSAGTSQLAKTELMPLKFIRQPHSVNHLIDLPYDYSELVDKLAVFSCPSIKNEDSRTPTMCLVCGVMLCSQSYCCQRDLNELASNYQKILQLQQVYRLAQASSESPPTSGGSSGGTAGGRTQSNDVVVRLPIDRIPALNFFDNPGLLFSGTNSSSLSSPSSPNTSGINQQLVGSCTYHAYECSGGVGVFLRIRNCQILLLSGRSKGCYMAAPYIDDHGETDFGLLRGNPLHLNRSDYQRLQHNWLSHAIPEQISRTLEYSPYASSINWHLH